MTAEKVQQVQPRIILHGGAGHITRENVPTEAYDAYRKAMLEILDDAYSKLCMHGATALDIATHAVSLLENNGLFNAGHGAVYTTAGTHELEASVMVSRGYRKRGVGVMNVTKAKNPVKLAREMLMRGEYKNGGGAQGHCQLQGETCDRLAEEWGLEIVKPSYFWTRRRWDEHRRGLGKSCDDETYKRLKRRADGVDDVMHVYDEEDPNESAMIVDEVNWNGKDYLPQGTVGAVVLDSAGIVCAATSTGGLTNKLPGRIGDTATIGAGFWSEEWQQAQTPPESTTPTGLVAMIDNCLPGLSDYMTLPSSQVNGERTSRQYQNVRAVGMSGTGNGDSFLRMNAVRTAAAIGRYSSSHPYGVGIPLQDAVSKVAGPGGILQESAGDRWGKTGEGEGGIIGIDFSNGKGHVVYNLNCGGMFRAWVDDSGKERFQIFRDDA